MFGPLKRRIFMIINHKTHQEICFLNLIIDSGSGVVGYDVSLAPENCLDNFIEYSKIPILLVLAFIRKIDFYGSEKSFGFFYQLLCFFF